MAVPDAIETRYARRGKKVTLVGLDGPSADMHQRLAGQLTGSH
ncbi:hypothetical protein [Streptomyces sp. NPDC016626]